MQPPPTPIPQINLLSPPSSQQWGFTLWVMMQYYIFECTLLVINIDYLTYNPHHNIYFICQEMMFGESIYYFHWQKNVSTYFHVN